MPNHPQVIVCAMNALAAGFLLSSYLAGAPSPAGQRAACGHFPVLPRPPDFYSIPPRCISAFELGQLAVPMCSWHALGMYEG